MLITILAARDTGSPPKDRDGILSVAGSRTSGSVAESWRPIVPEAWGSRLSPVMRRRFGVICSMVASPLNDIRASYDARPHAAQGAASAQPALGLDLALPAARRV